MHGFTDGLLAGSLTERRHAIEVIQLAAFFIKSNNLPIVICTLFEYLLAFAEALHDGTAGVESIKALREASGLADLLNYEDHEADLLRQAVPMSFRPQLA